MNKQSSVLMVQKTHLLVGNIIKHEIWQGELGQLYSYYDFGQEIKEQTYHTLATVYALHNASNNSVQIKDFVIRDQELGIDDCIFTDLINYCKNKHYEYIQTTISPKDNMNALVSFYSDLGFTSFTESDGFITTRLKL